MPASRVLQFNCKARRWLLTSPGSTKGENSFGKNSIQQVIPLYNGTGLIISTDKYILPNGEDIKAKGLTPNYEIKQNYTATLKNDKQMKKAVELITRLMKKEN